MKERWSTPDNFFDEINREFDFDVDVCAEEWNAKCPNYYSPDDDGLSKQWTGTCWMNPPYGRGIERWIRQAYTAAHLNGATVVCLVPARTDAAWWHDYAIKGEIRFVRGRIHFTDPNGKTGRPKFGCAVVIFRPPVPETYSVISR